MNQTQAEQLCHLISRKFNVLRLEHEQKDKEFAEWLNETLATLTLLANKNSTTSPTER